jgi:protein-S-isoprenylcysteine O-methyltransferase Ste14
MFLTTTGVFYMRKTAVVKQYPWLLAVLVPLFLIGSSATAILPVGSALSSSKPSAVVNMFALVSMVLSVLYVWISGKLLEAPIADPRLERSSASLATPR